MRTTDFHYDLPDELIASRPLEDRVASRMMVIDREKSTISHHHFREFPDLLPPDQLLVLNDTRVIPARVFSNDKKIELVRTDAPDPSNWWCLVRPGKKMKPGRTVEVGESTGTVIETNEKGERLIRWDSPPDLEEVGQLALPHYMEREPEKADRERYQTVYAKEEGAIAAPTAGLHFTPELLSEIDHTFLTLHVGVGTFRPVKAEDPREHDMHSERYHLTAEAAQKMNAAPKIAAVGTTVTRVLEHLVKDGKEFSETSGATDIFIYPPYQLKAVDTLLTNFHLPCSTLMMLVSAFASRDLILEAYREAVAEKYRFYSYGDCMLIL
ncbi:tRNA preQ1(34) S-adenosylmethionine ribosyltransferase-isomerase QueA [Akkermansiaceae bacterium]|nr:tRNA preQ1(34) S-adenosylmethionine ribosyltransferase-isomerase QueA [Akkermansiaceae bacterium]MDB4437340.1 tRNA preQ1(34) S-adenosylmethionine ribosyltransferase-isomerase QueA [bacterium]MDB4547365.1 tRNA preQ1(34) S-adenosylmethionine ribosyltransferase-isomerase QueA [Akkermansiaceae bacterium]